MMVMTVYCFHGRVGVFWSMVCWKRYAIALLDLQGYVTHACGLFLGSEPARLGIGTGS